MRVYKRDASDNWVQLGGDIDGEEAGDQSGFSVSLSSDGRVLAIGAWGNDENGENSGHVRVYERDDSVPLGWRQLGGDIDGERAGDGSGSVSLSSDGRVLAIGAWGNGSGHVRMYKRDTTSTDAPVGWSQLGGDIDGERAGDGSGRSVSLSSDGSVLAIGALYNGENGWRSGHVRVYERDDGVPLGWRQVGEDIDGERAGDRSGSSVSLSSDGRVLAIGAWGNDENGENSGHVRVYGKVVDAQSPGGFTWIQLGKDIDGEAEDNQLGKSVSLSSDGSVLAIGAIENKDFLSLNYIPGPGHVRVYHTGPSFSIQGAPAAVHTTDHFEVTFTFDRGVTGFNKEDIVVTHATVDNFMPVDASTYTYTATLVPDISTCGNITMNVAAGSAFDVDSNLPNFAAQQVIVEVMDDVPPMPGPGTLP